MSAIPLQRLGEPSSGPRALSRHPEDPPPPSSSRAAILATISRARLRTEPSTTSIARELPTLNDGSYTDSEAGLDNELYADNPLADREDSDSSNGFFGVSEQDHQRQPGPFTVLLDDFTKSWLVLIMMLGAVLTLALPLTRRPNGYETDSHLFLRTQVLSVAIFSIDLFAGTLTFTWLPILALLLLSGRKIAVPWVLGTTVLGGLSLPQIIFTFERLTGLERPDVMYYTYREVFWPSWLTGMMPRIPHGCEARVSTEQTLLFTQEFYTAQFGRVLGRDTNGPPGSGPYFRPVLALPGVVALPFNLTRFEEIRNSSTMCSSGFQLNEDLNGLGIRLGVYLQWVAAMLSNNFQPVSQNAARSVSFVSNICVLIVVLATTSSSSCIFSTEIEILHWLYWGGYICTFFTSPTQLYMDLGSQHEDLDWGTIARYIMNIIMFYHGYWYFWYGYDQSFARWPCGTHHLLTTALDPSIRFCTFRDVESTCAAAAGPLLLSLPLGLYKRLKRRLSAKQHDEASFEATDEPGLTFDQLPFVAEEASLVTRLSSWSRRIVNVTLHTATTALRVSKPMNQTLRPVYTASRTFPRVAAGCFAISAFIFFVTAIETSLRRNKVVGIYSLEAPGQYAAFTAGVATLCIVTGQLIKQERNRRWNAARSTAVDAESIQAEEDEIPVTLLGAIWYAARRPDVVFLREND